MSTTPETFRAQLIATCVSTGMDMGIAHARHEDTWVPADLVGFNAAKLDKYVEILEGLVNGEDLVRVQTMIAERYRGRSTQK